MTEAQLAAAKKRAAERAQGPKKEVPK